MAEGIESSHPEFNAKKIFLGKYVKTVKPNGETIPEASKDVISRFDRGSLIINFTGHGNEKQWADEKIFSNIDIDELENELYPFLVTATCEFGRQDDPTVVSSAELSVLRPKGGAIGLVTTARPVNAGTNFVLNQEFYKALFQSNLHNTGHWEKYSGTQKITVPAVCQIVIFHCWPIRLCSWQFLPNRSS